MKKFLPPTLAVLGGLLWAAMYQEDAYTLAPWVALAPLVLLLGHRRALWLAFLHGVVFWLASLPWIAPTLVTYGALPSWLAWVCLTGLCIYLALFFAAFGALGKLLWRGGWAVSLLGLPALFVALEWLRTHLFSGFPWNVPAYAVVDTPGALPLSAWIGAYGVTFLVLLANVAAARAVARRRWEPAVAVGLAVVFLLSLGGRWGAGEPVRPSGATPVTVRLLQPNILNQVDYDPAVAAREYTRLLETTRQACRPGSLVVWPESAAWPFVLARDPGFRDDVAGLTEQGGCALLLNSLQPRDDGSWLNSAFLIDDGRTVARYDKRHLVPFGEYVPLSGVFTFLDKVARSAGDFVPGREVTLLPFARERLGLSICFEIVFPDEVADLVRAGATTLVTVTNDAWYGDTAAPWQHFRAARFRAAEARRPLLRAAITGVSAVVDSDGSVIQSLGVFEEGVIPTRLLGRTDLSPAVRWPWAVPALCTPGALFAIFFAWRIRGARP